MRPVTLYGPLSPPPRRAGRGRTRRPSTAYAALRRLPSPGGDELLLAFAHKAEGDFRVGQRRMGDGVCDKVAFADVLFQKLHAGGGVVEQIADRDGRAAPARARPPAPAARRPRCGSTARIHRRRSWSAVRRAPRWRWRPAPRRGSPSVWMWARSSAAAILLVAWRMKAFSMESDSMPEPLSEICSCSMPPRRIESVICVAPASMAFVFEQFFCHRGGPLDNFARGDELGGVLV